MPKLKELIGTVVKTTEQVLHQDFIDRFAKSTLDSEHETLRYTSLAALGDFEAALALLQLGSRNILHTRESISVEQEPPLEKVLTVETVIKDLYEQQAGDKPMGFVVLQVTGKHNKKTIFVCERIWAVSGGFPRN